MNKQHLIEAVGSTHKLSSLLGINPSAIVRWSDNVPEKRIKQLAITVDSNYLKVFGKALIDNGYCIIPLTPKSKAPTLDKWQTVKATDQDVDNWVRLKNKTGKPKYEGIGIITTYTPVVDIDVLDTMLAAEMSDYVKQETGATLVRMGNPPKVAIPFRSDEPFKFSDERRKLTSRQFKDAKGRKHRIEITGENFQFVAFGTHPDTGKPYKWIGGESPLTTPWGELPVLTEAHVTDIIQHFEARAENLGWKALSETRRIDNVAGTGIEGVKSKADITPEKLRHDMLKWLSAENFEYDEWIEIGACLHHQFDGDDEGLALWCDWSAKNNSKCQFKGPFSPEAKWKSYKRDTSGNPKTVASILELIKIAKEKAAKNRLKELFKRYMFVRLDSRIVDLKKTPVQNDQEELTFTAFRKSYEEYYRLDVNETTGKTKKIYLVDDWHGSDEKKFVEGLRHKVSNERIITDNHSGCKYYNTFYIPNKNLPNTKGDLAPIHEHFEYLWSEEIERLWILDWLARKFQKPWLTSPVTPLHIHRSQGSGRGTFGALIANVFGDWNVSAANMSDLCGESHRSQYNGYLYKSLLCIVEEAPSDDSKYEVTEKLKSVLVNDPQLLNIKYGGSFKYRPDTDFIFFTNNIDALAIKSDDRRFNVFICEQPLQSESYYQRLRDCIAVEANINAFRNELLARDVSKFRCSRPMENEARKTLIYLSKSDGELEFERFIANPPAAWMTVEQIHKIVGADFDTGVSKAHLLKLLKRSDKATPRNRSVSVAGRDVRVWCLNKDRINDENTSVREEILRIDEKLKPEGQK